MIMYNVKQISTGITKTMGRREMFKKLCMDKNQFLNRNRSKHTSACNKHLLDFEIERLYLEKNTKPNKIIKVDF
jgi:hypothetical protein